ncbi:MAG: hybrid sensor histidine kinase/response regulator [Desulfobulbaceae bacterium]|nr:hybrid sensor histidine kinase/response regulator [Desulfobulbaceae bacterium]HIJ77911.1 hybrid sensor histidine kinase/response regulator [Deltaproteobacteria bacterium]
MHSTTNPNKIILLVDDDQYQLNSIERIFLDNDIEIIKATNAKEAFSLVKLNQVDLILLDIMMPEIDGFQVCQALKIDPETEDIPIIFLTAKDDEDIIVKGFELGAQDYVIKPFNSHELLARAKTHIELKEKSEELGKITQVLEERVAERTAQLVEANNRLLHLGKAKSDFISLISHELRTPLNAMTMLINSLNDTVHTEKQAQYVKYLQNSLDRLVHFSDSAILITSLTADIDSAITYAPILTKKLIIECFEKIKKRSESKGIQLVSELQSDELQIVGDASLIKRCLLIILENAITYSPQNGRVVVQAKSEDNNLLLQVNDSGPGFSQESLDMLFDFFTIDDIMHHSEGLGLGLAAAKLIMDAHFGTIEVENINNKGASVKLFFPNKVGSQELLNCINSDPT